MNINGWINRKNNRKAWRESCGLTIWWSLSILRVASIRGWQLMNLTSWSPAGRSRAFASSLVRYSDWGPGSLQLLPFPRWAIAVRDEVFILKNLVEIGLPPFPERKRQPLGGTDNGLYKIFLPLLPHLWILLIRTSDYNYCRPCRSRWRLYHSSAPWIMVAFKNKSMVGTVIQYTTLPFYKALAVRLQRKETYHEKKISA